MKNNDWQEAYFDLVNKVECECVQQGDLVPIWDQFKAMSAELAKYKALAETLAGAMRRIHKTASHPTNPSRNLVDIKFVSDLALHNYDAAMRQYKEARDAS